MLEKKDDPSVPNVIDTGISLRARLLGGAHPTSGKPYLLSSGDTKYTGTRSPAVSMALNYVVATFLVMVHVQATSNPSQSSITMAVNSSSTHRPLGVSG